MKLDKVKIINKNGYKYNIRIEFDYDVKKQELIFKDDIFIVIFDNDNKEIDRYSEKTYDTMWDKYKEFEEIK